jgi:Raf kinase inhibitor-like YbhB/YbcL family protein
MGRHDTLIGVPERAWGTATVAAVGLVLASCRGELQSASDLGATAPNSIRVESTAFVTGSAIPPAYTCDGEDRSPPLSWSGGPEAEEYALTVVDRDAPGGEYVHWVVFGIPATTTASPEGGSPGGAVEGENEFGRRGYGGPCPPPGDSPHRYVFTVYALGPGGSEGLEGGASFEDLADRIGCCILATGSLTGTYSR